MEKSSKERTFICKYCNKKFPSGKSLGGHIRIHTNEYSVDSHSYNNNNNNDDKRLVNHREIVLAFRQQQQQQHCCGQGFDSLKALCVHMDSHSQRDKKMVIEGSDSESFVDESSSSDSEIDQEHRNMALSLMMMSRDRKGYSLMMKSLILETKPSSREKIFNGDSLSDSDSSDSDYFVNGPKKSDSETGFESAFNKSLKRFRSIEKLGVEMSKSKRVLLSSYETDSCDSKIHRTTTSDRKSSSVLLKKSKGHGHECPICFRVFSSGQALGGHKRSHSFENQEHNKKKKKKKKKKESIHQVTEMHHDQIDLNLVPMDIDE